MGDGNNGADKTAATFSTDELFKGFSRAPFFRQKKGENSVGVKCVGCRDFKDLKRQVKKNTPRELTCRR